MSCERRARWTDLQEQWLSAPKRSGETSAHTRRAYETAMRYWLENLESMPQPVAPWEARPEHVRVWQRYMSKVQKLSEGTVNARLAAVSSFYQFVLGDAPWELESGNPFLHSSVRRRRVRPYGKAHPLGADRLGRLFTYTETKTHTVAGARNHALLLTCFLTGCRVSEVVQMRWSDIRPNRSRPEEHVFHWQGKGGKAEVSPLPARAYQAIVWYLTLREWAWGPEQYVWTPVRDHGTGNLVGGGRRRPHISAQNVNRILRDSLRKAGVWDWERFRVHDLRHSFAHLHYQQKKDLDALRQLLHHGSVATTDIYVRQMTDPVDQYSESVWAALWTA